MKTVVSIRSFVLLIGILLVCVSILSQQVLPDPPEPVSQVTVSVCGAVTAIVIAYDEGSIKVFHAPFPKMPRNLRQQWDEAISVGACEGTFIVPPMTVRPNSSLGVF